MLNLASQASLKLGRLAPEHRALFAEQGRKDFWFFLTGILGLNLREEPHKKMAEEFQEFTESGNPYALWLWPRETYKSTVFTQGGVLWRLVRNPEERVLITNAKLDNAMGFLRWIKDQIEGHEFFRWVYGDLTTKRWYTERVWIKGYNPQAKEPSIEIASVDSSVVSKHYCLFPGSLVLTSNGYLPVEKVRPGHRVLSSDGKFHSVVAAGPSPGLATRKVKIRPNYQTEVTELTHNHPVLVWRDNRFQWVEAWDIQESDMLVVPLPKGKNGPVSKVNKRLVKLSNDPDIWRLLGYWLADGCYTKQKNRIRIVVGKHEPEYAEDIRNIVESKLGVPVSIRETPSSTLMIAFTDPDFRALTDMCGHRAYEKHLPPFFINNHINRQIQLLIGYYRGDGSIHKNAVSFSSTSLDLLAGIQLILAKLSIPAGITYGNKPGEQFILGNKCNVRQSWTLYSSHPLLRMIVEGKAEAPAVWQPYRSFFTNDYWVVPIKELVKEEVEPQVVYNIQVADTGDFYCPGMIVHNTLIVADDLVNEAGVGTDDRVRYTITYFERLQPLLTWQGQMFFVGTRWAHWDLYQYLIDNFKDDPEWWISVRGIKETDSEGNVYSIFPDPEIGFPMERIARMEKTMPTEFWTHYMNQPKVDDTVRLPFDEDEHVFEELPPGVRGLRFITCDPATSQSSRADESAIVVTLQTPDDRLYVLDVRHGRWSPSQFCEELFALYRKWYPVRAVGIETSVAAQRLWLDLIQHEERRRETKLPIKELKTGVQKDAKHARILELEPYIMEGKYKVHVSCRGLIDQLVAYPGLSHDDILDAAAYIMQVKRPRPWATDNRWAGARTYRPRTKAGI